MDLSMNGCTFEGPVRDVQSHNVNKITNYYHSDLHEFLTPLDPEARHIAIRDGRTKGTGDWLLRSAEFREWHAGTGARVLCCTGEPGIGKTHLACRVIERLREDNDSVVCHVYCDYVDRERQTARNVLGALLLRVVMHMEGESDLIKELRSRRQRGTSLDIEETIAFLCRSVTSGGFRSVWICLDALDELVPGELDKLLHSFVQLCDIPAFYIFLTGRRNAGVESSINRMLVADATSITYLPISTIETCPDMQLFLIQKLKDDRYSDLLDSDMRETVFERLAGAESTFLLASLNVKMLLNQKTKSERREAIDSNALDLGNAYEQMLERIKERDPVYGMRILQWVLMSMEPLSLEELRYALAIRPGVKDLNPAEDLPPASIIEITFGLVTVESREYSYSSSTVRFNHFTLKEHLLAKASIHFPTGHSLLAEVTLAYLSHESIRNDMRRYHKGGDLCTFYEYAVTLWGHYVREGENEKLIQDACDFLRSINFQKISVINRITNTSVHLWPLHYEWSTLAYSSLFDIAAYFGLSNVLTQLASVSCDPQTDNRISRNRRDGHSPDTMLLHAVMGGHLETVQLIFDKYNHSSPGIKSCLQTLQHAASNGRLKVVKFLLEQEAIRAKLADIGPPALSSAAENGHLDVVQLLLAQKSIDVNAFGYFDGEPLPLVSAASRDHVEIVKLLLEQPDIDVNSTSYVMPALHRAANNGRDDIVKLLLERKDTNLNATNSTGKTALMHAAQCYGDSGVVVVRLLLSKGIQGLNLADNYGRTALFYAAEGGNTEIINLLLEQGDIDVGLRDMDGRTALSYAVEEGRVSVVQLLLERDTDVGNVDDYGRTALSYAAENGHMAVVQLLLARDDWDANRNLADHNGRTVLSYAAGRMSDSPGLCLRGDEITEVFLHWKNIDVNSADEYYGRTALSYAAEAKHVEAVWSLLQQKDIDVTLADKEGRTALWYAAGCDRVEPEWCEQDRFVGLVQLLLERDTDVGRVDNYGRTALSHAAEHGCLAVIRLLLARDDGDVNLNLADNTGRTVLSYAAENYRSELDSFEITEFFLRETSIDVNSADSQGRTALSYAAMSDNISALGLLLEQRDIAVGMVDKDGRTALSYAAGSGCTAAVQLLLEHVGVDIGPVDNNGRSALSYALQRGGAGASRLLLMQENTNMNQIDNDGRSLLSYASYGGRPDVIRLVLEQGDVNVNSTDKYGLTALSYAAQWGKIGAIELLLEQKDINVGLCDENGLTALSYAERTGCRGGRLTATLLRNWERVNMSREE